MEFSKEYIYKVKITCKEEKEYIKTLYFDAEDRIDAWFKFEKYLGKYGLEIIELSSGVSFSWTSIYQFNQGLGINCRLNCNVEIMPLQYIKQKKII